MWDVVLRESGKKSWVVFESGTCVLLREPEVDLVQQATRLLAEWGPVHVGTPAGDFNVLRTDAPGWLVTSHHPAIFNYVAPEDVEAGAGDLLIGLSGRNFRDADAHRLRVVRVHDGRAAS